MGYLPGHSFEPGVPVQRTEQGRAQAGRAAESEVDVGSTDQRVFRRARGIALGIAIVLVAGAAGEAAYAVGADPAHAVRLALRYSCQFPSGEEQVSVIVAATCPASAVAGQQIQPAGLHVSGQLPAAAVADLRKLGAASVTAADTLAVAVTGLGSSVPAQWAAGAATSYQLPAAGDLELTAAGTAEPMAARGAGQVAFTAGHLALALSGSAADGSPVSPATLQVSCALRAGSSGLLARVDVTAASPSARPSPARPRQAPATRHIRFPKGCGKIKTVGAGVATCGDITGYSDVRKLDGAALLQPKRPARPGLVNVDFAEKHKFANGKLIEYSTGELYYKGEHQLPPVTPTLLGFGFVPVTATLRLTELTPI